MEGAKVNTTDAGKRETGRPPRHGIRGRFEEARERERARELEAEAGRDALRAEAARVTPAAAPARAAPRAGVGGAVGQHERPKVLAATDGSAASVRAGEHAVRLAERLGAKLFVLNVVDEDRAFRSGIHYGEAVEELAEDGREATGVVAALAAEAGVESEELLFSGEPARVIVGVSERVGAHYVVVGSRGVSVLEHALFGSVAEEVLKHAHRPVLVAGTPPAVLAGGQEKGATVR